jgi:hypothetical protein
MKVWLYTALAIFISVSGPSFGQEAVTYSITLGDQNSNSGRCAVNVEIEGIGDTVIIASAPNYVVNFSIPVGQNKNHVVKVKGTIKWGIPPNNAPACSVDGQILINQLILDEWRPIKERFSGTDSLRCVNMGLSRIKELNDGSATSERLYIRPADPRVSKIFDACDRLLAEPLRRNVPCSVNEPRVKTSCDEAFFSETSPGRRLALDSALYALLDGQQIKKGLWETEAAQAARAEQQRNEEERRRAQEAERQRIAKQREEREAWLKTAEGKKFIAEEEAKRKKAEESRRQEAVAAAARMAREYPYYAVITCGMQNQHINIIACFSGRHVGTELEIKNGGEYNLYQVQDLMGGNVGRETGDGFIIDLRQSFQLKAQNSADNLILGIKIFKRGGDEVVFQKKVSKFGVISVRN